MEEKVKVKKGVRIRATLNSRNIETSYRWFYTSHGDYCPGLNFHSGKSSMVANLQKRPSVCLCLIRNKRTGRGGIGLAICSFSENPSRIKGRGYAYRRAAHAYVDESSSEPIGRDEAIQTLACTDMPMKPFLQKAIASGSRYFDTLVKTIWTPRENTRRKGHEESKKESVKEARKKHPSWQRPA